MPACSQRVLAQQVHRVAHQRRLQVERDRLAARRGGRPSGRASDSPSTGRAGGRTGRAAAAACRGAAGSRARRRTRGAPGTAAATPAPRTPAGRSAARTSKPCLHRVDHRVADEQVEHDLGVALLEVAQQLRQCGRARSRSARARAAARPASRAPRASGRRSRWCASTSSLQSRKNAWPISDSRTARVVRWNSGPPSSSSSCCTRVVTTDFDRRSCRAASAKLCVCATRTKASMLRKRSMARRV